MITIEQSKVLAKRRAQNELNDCIVAMHTKKVAGKKTLIEDAKFLSCIPHLRILLDLSLFRSSSWFLMKKSRARWMISPGVKWQ